MVMDGIAIGDPVFIQAHCRGIVDQMALDMQALNALLLPGRMGRTHPQTAWVLATHRPRSVHRVSMTTSCGVGTRRTPCPRQNGQTR